MTRIPTHIVASSPAGKITTVYAVDVQGVSPITRSMGTWSYRVSIREYAPDCVRTNSRCVGTPRGVDDWDRLRNAARRAALRAHKARVAYSIDVSREDA